MMNLEITIKAPVITLLNEFTVAVISVTRHLSQKR